VAAALRGRATQRGRAAGGAPGVSSGRHSGGVGGWRTVLRGRGRRGGRRSEAVAGGAPGAVAGGGRAPRPRGGWPGRVWAAGGVGGRRFSGGGNGGGVRGLESERERGNEPRGVIAGP
jgi:hypothetical protein